MFSKTCGFHKFYNSVSHFCRVSSFILWSLPFPFGLYWFASFDKVYSGFSGVLPWHGNYWPCILLHCPLCSISFLSFSMSFRVLDHNHWCISHWKRYSAIHWGILKSAVPKCCIGQSSLKRMFSGNIKFMGLWLIWLMHKSSSIW